MSTLEYIPTRGSQAEAQAERRLSLEHELHLVESASIVDALPEGFNVDDSDLLHQNRKEMGPRNFGLIGILAMFFCCKCT